MTIDYKDLNIRVIDQRKKTPDQRALEAAILEMYLEALGVA